MFMRVIYNRVLFVLYVTLIPLQCVPFILYQDMERLVLDIISLNTDEFASMLGVFMPNSLPSLLSSLTRGTQVPFIELSTIQPVPLPGCCKEHFGDFCWQGLRAEQHFPERFGKKSNSVPPKKETNFH